MKSKHLLLKVDRPMAASAEEKRAPVLLNLLRMRSDFARRQQMTGTWMSNSNTVSSHSSYGLVQSI
ncbi:MAG: hypothetical protein K0Q55_1840 [Verrucomicrobia bacterium]|jgi:hypothetical protein|nr:hypothetical protein [Verrucomicrobiota bacterium]